MTDELALPPGILGPPSSETPNRLGRWYQEPLRPAIGRRGQASSVYFGQITDSAKSLFLPLSHNHDIPESVDGRLVDKKIAHKDDVRQSISYPSWLNAAAWLVISLVPFGLVLVIIDLTIPGLLSTALGFAGIWVIGTIVLKLKAAVHSND